MAITIQVDGQKYGGWTKANTSRSNDGSSSPFSFSIAFAGLDIPGGVESLSPFKKGKECKIYINDILFLTGKVEKVPFRFDKDKYEFTVEGRSKTKDILKSAAIHKTGQFNKLDPLKISKEICDKFGIEIKDKSTGDKKPLERYIIGDGEMAVDTIKRVLRLQSLQLSDDEEGNLVVLNQDSDGLGVDLYLDRDSGNIISVSGNLSEEDETQEYEAVGASIPTDKKYGKDAMVIAGKAIDKTFKDLGKRRVVIQGDADIETLKKRATHEARRIASDKNELIVNTDNMTPQGDIWRPNKKHNLRIWFRPDLNGVYLLKSVSYSEEKSSYEATLTFVKTKGYSSDGEGEGSDEFDNESLETEGENE